MTRAELKNAMSKIDETIMPDIMDKEAQKALAEEIYSFTGQKLSVSLTMDILRAVHHISENSEKFSAQIKIGKK